jgi:hypothetical protein
VAKGINVDLLDKNGMTPLMLSARSVCRWDPREAYVNYEHEGRRKIHKVIRRFWCQFMDADYIFKSKRRYRCLPVWSERLI